MQQSITNPNQKARILPYTWQGVSWWRLLEKKRSTLWFLVVLNLVFGVILSVVLVLFLVKTLVNGNLQQAGPVGIVIVVYTLAARNFMPDTIRLICRLAGQRSANVQ